MPFHASSRTSTTSVWTTPWSLSSSSSSASCGTQFPWSFFSLSSSLGSSFTSIDPTQLTDVRDYLVPQSLALILESLFDEYGDVGAETNLSSRLKMNRRDCWVCVCILSDFWVCVCCFCVWLTRKISCWVCVLCLLLLCLVDKEGRSVVFIFVFVFLGLWFLDFNFVLDMGLCSYCSCPSHPMISINVIFCFYFCF